MAREFILPDIGEGLTEAEVVRWLVPVGETVAVDQPVVELETDKAVVEIPSPFAGVVLHHGAGEGQTVLVGSILVVIGDAGETWPSSAEVKPIVGTLAEEAEVLSVRRDEVAGERSGVQALPLVRRLAKELGIDLATVSGSGPNGRIMREDVEAAASGAVEPAPKASSGPPAGVGGTPSPSPAPLTGDERRPLSKLRRTIAANMTRSWNEIPHVTVFETAEATRLLAARRSLETRHAIALPLEALAIKAVIPALAAYPEFNATLEGDDLIVHGGHHLGVAVDTADGLLVAVVRDAGSLGLLEVAAEVRRLAEGAKERKLKPEELTGQTFTISNIGAVGGGHGTPIIPPGTTAILSLGRATDQPVAREGHVEIAPMLPLSLSYDHRVIDGALGRRFMAMVIENLAEPALFLV